MLSCYSELNETPIPSFYMERAGVSNCLLLLEEKQEKPLAEWQKASFCPCLAFHTHAKACVHMCLGVGWGEALCTPLAEVEIMTESERQLSLGLKLQAPAVVSCILPRELGLEVSGVSSEAWF